MIAAHTLRSEGVPRYEIQIFSDKKQKSVIGGAQYLHAPVYDEPADFIVDTVQLGHAHLYAEKVYGDASIKTSWPAIRQMHKAWNLRKVYNRLWSDWSSKINTSIVDSPLLESLAEEYKQVFLGIPAYTVCKCLASFPSMSYALVEKTPRDPWMDNIVIYNGRESDDWYRYSSIEGHQWMEFNEQSCPSVLRAAAVMGLKPMGTECRCCEELDVVRIGRPATWDRKVLLHHVADQVRSAL